MATYEMTVEMDSVPKADELSRRLFLYNAMTIGDKIISAKKRSDYFWLLRFKSEISKVAEFKTHLETGIEEEGIKGIRRISITPTPMTKFAMLFKRKQK